MLSNDNRHAGVLAGQWYLEETNERCKMRVWTILENGKIRGTILKNRIFEWTIMMGSTCKIKAIRAKRVH